MHSPLSINIGSMSYVRKSRIFTNGVQMPRYRYTVVMEQDEEGIYIATCPAIEGRYTQGDTYKEWGLYTSCR
jgi:hypothetical protein